MGKRFLLLWCFILSRAIFANEADKAGALNADELHACFDLECHHFIAPCTLLERNKGKVLNAMDEVYLNQMSGYTDRGFCAYPPRVVTSEQYSKNTCLFLFVKKEPCT